MHTHTIQKLKARICLVLHTTCIPNTWCHYEVSWRLLIAMVTWPR